MKIFHPNFYRIVSNSNPNSNSNLVTMVYIDYEEEEEKDQETSKEEDIHQEPTPEKEEMNLTISCNALVGITIPQSLGIEGHVRKKKDNLTFTQN